MAAYTYPGGQDGQCLHACHITYLFNNAQTNIENNINITKLNYSNGLTEVSHDYMVVDVMTDLKPKKIERNKEYYLRMIRNKKMDLEVLTGKDKTEAEKEISRLQGKLDAKLTK